MRLLLTFASEQLKVEPSRVEIGDLDAPLIGRFLDHLERVRGCSPRTRNQRLTAIRSLYRYAVRRHPEHAAVIERVLAIPPKRHGKTLITFLTKEETDALITAVDVSTWTGRRDRAMLMLAAQTGLRASELVGLTIADVHLGTGAHVNCIGKGRKQRITPLTKATIRVLRAWLSERGGHPGDPLFPTSQGQPRSRDALEHASLNTPRPPPSCARRCEARRSRHTCSGIRQRCGY
jgi:integrase/recombinase XerD